jgi:hypothetical protein
MRYQRDTRSTGVYLRTDPTLKAELRRRAGIGLAAARANIRNDTGDLARSGHVEDMGARGGRKRDRMELQVVFDAPHAASVEFGTARARARPYLRPAIPIIERG